MTLSSESVLSQMLVIEADPGGDDEIFYLMKAPRALTIETAYIVSEQANNAGTAIAAQVEDWGEEGTALEGTAVTQMGGTAAANRLSARTPAEGTVNTAANYFDEGDWMVIRYIEEGSGWQSGDRLQIQIDYVIGKGNTTV